MIYTYYNIHIQQEHRQTPHMQNICRVCEGEQIHILIKNYKAGLYPRPQGTSLHMTVHLLRKQRKII